MTGAAHVGLHCAAMDGVRKLGEHVGVLFDEGEEGGSPGTQRDDVDEAERRVPGAVNQPGAQGDRATEVVRDDVWTLEPPLVEQVREHVALHAEVDVVVRLLGGSAVTGHVPQVDGEAARQCLSDRSP